MRQILVLLLAAGLAGSASAGPAPQLAQSVSQRLERFGLEVAPGALTTAQAAALHILLTQRRPLFETRQRARAILTSPDFRD